jgi:ABC-type transporter Mla subunit MlaD
MAEFQGSWDDNRDHLADKLTKLGELAEETADGFEEADEALAREIAEAVEDVSS